MIIQEKVEVKITNRNRNYYKKLNYVIEGDILIVNVNDLPKGSNIYLDVSCDICYKILNVSFYNYKTCFSKYNLYTCKDCSIEHKTKKTNLIKYGTESPLKSKDILNKLKQTNFKKYGTYCCLLSPEIRKKTRETNLKRFGVEFPSQSNEVKQKRKDTNIGKYGVDNIFKCEQFKKELRESRIKNWKIVEDNLNFEWQNYKNEVRRITRTFKQEIFENWNGCDFYDGEYIKNNLELHHNSKEFPTIDHKISVFEGFHRKIPPIIIGDISNLVITKRSINSKKSNSFISDFQKCP
jgi:hypothetical protein